MQRLHRRLGAPLLAIIGFAALAAAAPAGAAVAVPGGWVYTVSNDPGPGANTVVALDYFRTGSLRPLRARTFPTRGTGERYVKGQSLAILAGDHQIATSPDKRFLLAANQGSNTIAVFRINRRTGGITHVAGSPFPSGGVGPTAIGVSGRRVVVANKGMRPGEPPPGAGNLVSFRFSSAGRLTPVSTVASPGAPLDASIAPNGSTVFDSDFLAFKLHVLHLGSDATLTDGPAGQFDFDPAVTADRSAPPGFPPDAPKLAFGIGVHPTQSYVYYTATVSERIAIYTYDPAGNMTFVKAVDNPGVAAPCWNTVTPNGRYMYTANRVTKDVTAWRISPDGADLTRLGDYKLPEAGGTGNMAVSADGRTLFVNAAHDDADIPFETPDDGNFVEAFRINGDGSLRALSVAALPVRFSTIPLGLATVGYRR